METSIVDVVIGMQYGDEGKGKIANQLVSTGNYDYVLITTFKEMGDYEDFTNKYFLENPNIKHFTSMVVMNKVKENLSIPIN